MLLVRQPVAEELTLTAHADVDVVCPRPAERPADAVMRAGQS